MKKLMMKALAIAGMTMGLVQGAWAKTVQYIAADGSTQSVDAMVLDDDIGSLTGNWYYLASGTLTLNKTFLVSADSVVIIGQGATVSITGAAGANGTASGQQGGEGGLGFQLLGDLTITSEPGDNPGSLAVTGGKGGKGTDGVRDIMHPENDKSGGNGGTGGSAVGLYNSGNARNFTVWAGNVTLQGGAGGDQGNFSGGLGEGSPGYAFHAGMTGNQNVTITMSKREAAKAGVGSESTQDVPYAENMRARFSGARYAAFEPAKTAEITVKSVENTTAYTNEVSEATKLAGDVTYTAKLNESVTVIYAANYGYMFPDGRLTFPTNFTVTAATTITLTDEQKPIPLPPVKFEVSTPDGGKAEVYTNDVLVTGDTVLSNSIAYVVYTVNDEEKAVGKYFENGETEVRNQLDTTTNPATDKSAYVPTKTGTARVQLGVVAQHYPWNGTLDIQYKTPFANGSKIVTFKANGTVIGTANGTGGQEVTANFDLNAVEGGAFKDKKLKDVKITATIQ